jgi:hypothetical protein
VRSARAKTSAPSGSDEGGRKGNIVSFRETALLKEAGEEVAGGESKDAGHGGEQGAVAVDADQTGAEGDGDGLGVVMRVSMAE